MAKGHKPVAGSRAFWPKKRAKRIYSGFRFHGLQTGEQTKPLVFAGYKAGMTQVSFIDNRKGSVTQGQTIVSSVTVVDAPALIVAGIKIYKKTLYGLKNTETVLSDKLSKDLARKTKTPKDTKTKEKMDEIEKVLDEIYDIRLLVHTKPRESGIGKKKPELFEVDIAGNIRQKWDYAKQKLGAEIKANDVFKDGDWIDTKAVTKGKGYQGPVKRFGVKIRTRKDKGKRRHIGNLGARNVARVLPGKLAMPGQLGFQTRTEYNKRILKIGSGGLTPKGGWLNYGTVPGDYVLIHGSVPGPKKRLIMLRKGVRAPENKKEAVEIKEIVLDSQQGV